MKVYVYFTYYFHSNKMIIYIHFKEKEAIVITMHSIDLSFFRLYSPPV